jgi:hypothetical protein
MLLIVRTALVMGALMISRIIGRPLCHPLYGLLINHRATTAAAAATAAGGAMIPHCRAQGHRMSIEKRHAALR